MEESEDYAEKLAQFFRQTIREANSIEVRDCKPVTGGYSCRLTRFKLIVDGEEKSLLARADAPSNAVVIPSDRAREWDILSALTERANISMPAARYYDDGSVLGAKTIFLDFIESQSFLVHLRSTPESDRVGQTEMFAALAAEIHGVDIALLPQSVVRPDSWHAYIDEQVNIWKQAEKSLSQSFPIIRYIAAWLDANRPEPTPLALVHGEFQTSNQIVDDDNKLYAVDWEFTRIGDPREDLGWAVWVETIQPPMIIAKPSMDIFCQTYRKYSGLSEDVINPLTLAFFSILPAIKIFEGVLKQQEEFSMGINENLNTGYLVGAVVGAFEEWFKAAQQIDAARQHIVGSVK